MAVADERKKILDLLESGRISADQASELLRALAGAGPPPPVPPVAPVPPTPPRSGTARLLRISVDAAGDEGPGTNARIRVNLPLGLAKFAARFLPAEAKGELDAQGIDLTELIASLSTETPEGKIVDIDVDEDGKGKKAKIVVEVV